MLELEEPKGPKGQRQARVQRLQGYLAHKKTPTPLRPP
jgi:hypothetical protein